MIEWLDIVILAIVQGIAEFLPISSSGHLVLVGRLLGNASDSAVVEILLHTGTLLSILVVYWQRIWRLLTSDRRVIPLIIIGTLPAVFVGLPIKLYAEWLLKSPLLAGCMLLVTASLLLLLNRIDRGEKEYADLSWKGALLIGCFQACAILPGLSRSGSTIFGGRLMGLRGTDAVTFSFLLAIPALSGATILALEDLREQTIGREDVVKLVAGAAISFLLGIVALRWLMRWSRKDRLHWFAYWCGPVGVLVIVAALLGWLEVDRPAVQPAPAIAAAAMVPVEALGATRLTSDDFFQEIVPGGGIREGH